METRLNTAHTPQARQEQATAARQGQEEATTQLFQAIAWGYVGSAAGLLALALLGLFGAHIPWIHIARGIVTGS